MSLECYFIVSDFPKNLPVSIHIFVLHCYFTRFLFLFFCAKRTKKNFGSFDSRPCTNFNLFLLKRGERSVNRAGGRCWKSSRYV